MVTCKYAQNLWATSLEQKLHIWGYAYLAPICQLKDFQKNTSLNSLLQ